MLFYQKILLSTLSFALNIEHRQFRALNDCVTITTRIMLVKWVRILKLNLTERLSIKRSFFNLFKYRSSHAIERKPYSYFFFCVQFVDESQGNEGIHIGLDNLFMFLKSFFHWKIYYVQCNAIVVAGFGSGHIFVIDVWFRK